MVTLTQNATSEVKKLLQQQKNAPGLVLRVGVEDGCCQSLSYTLGLDQARADDFVSEHDGVKVVVDPKSDTYLDGSTVDFVDGPEGSGFKFVNPKAKKSCGCGDSFSV